MPLPSNHYATELERAFYGGYRRPLSALFDELDAQVSSAFGGWMRLTLHDLGDSVVVRAEVPGLAEKDLRISLERDVLTVAGDRATEPPQGYVAHRRERSAARFSRSMRLRDHVDAERVTATLKNGILTVTLPRAAEQKPRQIAITTTH